MDARIYKPLVDKDGLSDPVVIGTDKGELCIAWWDDNAKMWNTADGQTFGGGVVWWSEIRDIPGGYQIDWDLYGGNR